MTSWPGRASPAPGYPRTANGSDTASALLKVTAKLFFAKQKETSSTSFLSARYPHPSLWFPAPLHRTHRLRHSVLRCCFPATQNGPPSLSSRPARKQRSCADSVGLFKTRREL